MLGIETLSEQQRRLLAHVYASLREHIRDELEYDRLPDFAPLEDEDMDIMTQVIYEAITRLMVTAHTEEAAKIQVKIDAYMVNWRRLTGAEQAAE
jgi:hypothetical protein